MQKNFTGLPYTLTIILALAVTACTAQPTAQSSTLFPATAMAASEAVGTPTGPQATYTDPFAYCSAVGTIDTPDSRYVGEPVPLIIIQGFLKAAGLQNNGEPVDILRAGTLWRCMGNAVYVCNVGANLPCDSKADTNKNPTQAMQGFCKTNPNADFLPMSVTGHSTIYSWHCARDNAEVLDQIDQVDVAGYITNIWYKLPPNP